MNKVHNDTITKMCHFKWKHSIVTDNFIENIPHQTTNSLLQSKCSGHR